MTDKVTEEDKQVSMLRAFYVFNVAQIDGLEITTPAPLPSLEARHTAAEALIAATEADIRHGGNEACYVPSQDFIQLPPFGAFKSTCGYYATSLHELGHWSGHETRLARDLSHRFKTRGYAAEELVAELTAAFLCAHLGIEGELRHAGYIKHWIELLKHDERAFFTASAKAQQSADYILGTQEKEHV